MEFDRIGISSITRTNIAHICGIKQKHILYIINNKGENSMGENIERLTANDFEEAMDFLNLVFSQAHRPHNFEKLLPGLYQPTQESMQCNFVLRKNGRIRSLAGLFPMTISIGGELLKAAGIGGVATHINERKSGMMKRLLDACIQEMHLEGYHISCLGGDRQRYGYFGYEKAGSSYNYDITRKNIKHSMGNTMNTNIHFEPMKENDEKWICLAKKMYDNQPIHCIRPLDKFYTYLRAWNMQPWAALDENNCFIGYLVANESKNQVSEIFANSSDVFFDMICNWVTRQSRGGISLFLTPWAQEYAWKAGSISESVSIQEAYNWKVIKWVEVLRALLKVKSQISSLIDGEVCIHIKGYGTIRISVEEGLPLCEQIEGNANMTWESSMATRSFFGPMPHESIVDLPEGIKRLFSSWFPLPLCWPSQDRV
jgi:predicted N-acetyltransferase YhbS